MKQGTILFLVAVLVMGFAFTALAADKPKLELWALRTFITDANELMEKQAKEWGKQNNVDVSVQFFTFADVGTKYVAAIETDSTPCIGEFDTSGPARYSAMGQLLPLDDLLKEIEQENGSLYDNLFQAIRFNDKVWVIPRYQMLGAMYVRKDLFDKFGLKIPDTWDEVYKAAQVIEEKTNGEVYGLGQSYGRGSDADGNFQMILWNFEAYEVDKEGKIAINSPQTLDAVKFLVKLHELNPPGVLSWTDMSNNEAYIAGKVAMVFNSPSIYYALKKNKSPYFEKTLFLKYPKGPGGEHTRCSGGGDLQTFGVFKSCKQPALAKKLIKYLTTGKRLEDYTVAGAGAMGPTYPATGDLEFWKSDPNYGALLENAKLTRFFGYPGPLTAAAVEVRARHVYTDMVAMIIARGEKPENALAEAEKRINEIYTTIPKW